MTKIKKWQLLDKKDVSPSDWFPIEKRTYQMANGKIIDDFYVTTLQNSVHIIPRTKTKEYIMVKMFKQGPGEIMIQFPAGRVEDKHENHLQTAVEELEEEAGIKVKRSCFKYLGKLSVMSTKATELAHIYFIDDISINSHQKLDPTEEIEVLKLSENEINQKIKSGEIWESQTVTAWHLHQQNKQHL
jgi:8-oxo-dGTP pyrophosphatase MutT (NUDIX family)